MSPPGAGDDDESTGDDPSDQAVPPRDGGSASDDQAPDNQNDQAPDNQNDQAPDHDDVVSTRDAAPEWRRSELAGSDEADTDTGMAGVPGGGDARERDEMAANRGDRPETRERTPGVTDAPGDTGGKPATGQQSSDADTGSEWRAFAYDVLSSMVAVVLVGALLFAVSGVWPPMVAVESPSMTPNMKTGDLVFVMEADRFPGEGATGETGVVTAHTGRTTDADYRKFGHQGDVIVYTPDGDDAMTPIIHRAMFWVEEGENWYDEADRQAVGRYSECGDSPDEALPSCPAPHDGFITKGDANGIYDQAQGLSAPVRPSWVVGTAEVRVPLLGCVRLRTDRCTNAALGTGPVVGATPAGTVGTTPADDVTATGATLPGESNATG